MKAKSLTREEKWKRLKVGVVVEDSCAFEGFGKIVKKLKTVLHICYWRYGYLEDIMVYDRAHAVRFLTVVK